MLRIQITFKTIQTPATKEFEQWKLEHKEDHLTLNCTQKVELIRYERIRTFGNLRNFYCLQDHTTSNNTQWGKTRPRTMMRQLLPRPTVHRTPVKTPETSVETALAQTIAEAVAMEMAKAHAHYQAILNERSAATLQTSLKVSSGTNGFKVMHPFNWTKDKSIYQRWQLWSEKARLALDAMEGDSEKTKISYFHHWINGEGMEHFESWKNSKTLISQSAYDELESTEGKYSSECIESFFTLFELLLAPKSNQLLAVEELHFIKQGSMTSGEFHSHIVKIAKRCKFPNPGAEERAIRDAIFLGMNSQWARDKAINLMNEEAKELTVEFLMNQLAIEDCNAQHKILSQLNSSSSVNFAAYDHRQNKGKSNKSKCTSGKNVGQNNSGTQGSSNQSQPSRKPPGMEGKCMRCGKPEHQPGQKCAAKNAKCKECHKIGMSIQEKRQESTSCPDSTTSD